jgi:DNA-binding CsgD family transcriptional regulator
MIVSIPYNSVKHHNVQSKLFKVMFLDNIFSGFKTYWKENHPEDRETKLIDENLVGAFPLFQLAQNTRLHFSIFNHKTQITEYSTDNTMDLLGFSKEVFLKNGTAALIESMNDEQSLMLKQCVDRLKIFIYDMKGKEIIENTNISYCGITYNHRQKGIIKLLCQQVFFESDEMQMPIRELSVIRDITHLIKKDACWFKADIVSPQKTYYLTYKGGETEFMKTEILSIREKEILRHIAQGKDPEYIAKELFLSKATINNHRQNMLNKLGAKDSTALAQLAKLTQII